MPRIRTLCALLSIAAALPAGAQQPTPMQHMAGMKHDLPSGQPTQPGQAAFGAIKEVVALLESDSTTDWSKVDLEALRQHLIDMDRVTMRAQVRQTNTSGGLVIDATGDATVAAAIRRMVGAHAPMLDAMDQWRATATAIPDGMRLTVTARDAGDARTIARIRGLGFIGLMTEGEHHGPHHLMIARGMGAHAHQMP